MKHLERLGTITLLAMLLTAAGCSEPPQPPAAAKAPAALRKVSFNMAWLPQGSMVGIVVAQERGFFSDVGLEVDAVRGFGGTRTTNEVDQGMFDFGYGDPVSVILNRGGGGQARLVAMLNSRWPAGLCYLADKRRIETPADLRGLRVGGGQNSAVQALLPVWLGRNGMSSADITLLQLNPSVIVTSLIEGQIDAAECWSGNSRPLFVKEARAAGHELASLDYGKFNLDIYGSGIITTDRMIREQPETVRGFVAAVLRGYAFAKDNAAPSLAVMQQRYPILDPEVTAAQIGEMSGLVQDAGRMQPEKMARTRDFVAAGYADVATKVQTEDVYTNDFLK
jgi:NitT/TauT family transport system substrate-binding protein